MNALDFMRQKHSNMEGTLTSEPELVLLDMVNQSQWTPLEGKLMQSSQLAKYWL